MHFLMYMGLKIDEIEDAKDTLRYMIKNRFPSGNYPASEEDRNRDVLVHWCHGAPGVALTLAKAAEVFGDDEFLEAAINAAKVTDCLNFVSSSRIVFQEISSNCGQSESKYTENYNSDASSVKSPINGPSEHLKTAASPKNESINCH